jgi:hypothetical protein
MFPKNIPKSTGKCSQGTVCMKGMDDQAGFAWILLVLSLVIAGVGLVWI